MRRQDCEQLEQNLAPNAHPFAGLEGKKSCHTGYRKTAGWVLPVGTLFDLQLMPRTEIEGVQADAASVANFFEGVCAPGACFHNLRWPASLGAVAPQGACASVCSVCVSEHAFTTCGGQLLWGRVRPQGACACVRGGAYASAWQSTTLTGGLLANLAQPSIQVLWLMAFLKQTVLPCNLAQA
eukprot:1159155-Pelagomonas_calceolata.AAC.1